MTHSTLKWISDLFADFTVDEVLVNASQNMQILGAQVRTRASPFASDRELIATVQGIAYSQGLRLDPVQPAAGGLLSLDSLELRWHALLPPIARDGPLLSLRRHRFQDLRLTDFASPAHIDLLRPLLQGDRPLFIVGPTGAGKTSLLMSLLRESAAAQRVAILEQVPEIPRLEALWIRTCAQAADLSGDGAFTLSQVFDELLRLRPDRIVIGELRQQEASVFKRSLLAGHGGVWCTLHAEGPQRLAERLADLSSDAASSWLGLLDQSVVLVMQREKPRLREAWMRWQGEWDLIFCAKEK